MDSKLREIRDRMKLQAEITDNGIEHQVILQQDDYIYLWEHTEKAKELEGNNESLKDRIDHFRYNLRTRRKISEHYKEALEFYADEKNYDRPYDNEDYFDYLPSEMDFDIGEKARRALKGEST